MKFLTKRLMLGFLALLVVAAAGVAGLLLVYVQSPAFQQKAREFIVQELEKRTGTQVSLERLEWDLWEQRFRFEGLTLRGLEPPADPPLAHFYRIDAGISFRTLLQRRIDLFELIISQPEFHVSIAPDGGTNVPSPRPAAPSQPVNFTVSIDDFRILDGAAFINERRVNIDFGVANLGADIDFSGGGIVSSHLRYDGILDRGRGRNIPYTLDADLDYARNTLLVRRMDLHSDGSQIGLQGQVDDVLSRQIAGKLQYTGTVELPFLNYFFTREQFSGRADVAGDLEFSAGYFFTTGTTEADALEVEGWRATDLRADYSYHYPDRRAALRNLRSRILSGSARGDIVVEHLPGPSRVLLSIDYAGIDAASLARAYPWDPKYRIYSMITGTLNGWFEGKFERFDFHGNAGLTAYAPAGEAGLVPLSVGGTTGYEAQPGRVRVVNADMRLPSTSVKAEGLIEAEHSDLRMTASSSDLKDAAFLYEDANGSGSFDGTLTGPIKTPVLNGSFELEGHVFKQQWTIGHAAGNVILDTRAAAATLANVRVTEGQSEVLINGNAALDGSAVDVRLHTDRARAVDLAPFTGRDLAGIIAGEIHVTSLEPVEIEGDLSATNFSIDGRFIGDMEAHVKYFEPVAALSQLTIRQNGSLLTGDLEYDRSSDAVSFAAEVTSVDLQSFRDLGLPESIRGIIRQAEMRGTGTTRQPNIHGEALIEDLTVFGEVFPQVRAGLVSRGSALELELGLAGNLGLTARIDMASPGYPFTATGSFTRYSVERLAGIPEGMVLVTGSANISGLLTEPARLSGQGRIESAEAIFESRELRTDEPFVFDFDSDRLMLSSVALTGEGTQVSVTGTVGFMPEAPLGLDVSGRIDVGLLAAADPDWLASGSVNVEGRILGTVRNPVLRGVARFSDATLGRRGLFTSITGLTGDFFFDDNRITLNNLQGQMGGGTVQAQGTASLEQGQLEAMNVRIETDDVRIRYPEGLRTVLGGSLVLQGNFQSPLLQGNLQIQSLAYQSGFDEFLQIFQSVAQPDRSAPSPFGALRLAIRLEGSQNISIRNQLAEVEARIDLNINGTVDHPTLTGHVEASGGTLMFQGRRYELTRGNIDFVNPLAIQPVMDIQAETTMRDYRVILSVSGPADRLRLDLRSDPPLPQLEIVSLVAGGQTREELQRSSEPASTNDVPTSEQLFQSGAASILFDLLQSRVGSRFGLLGLDRVRIDPLLVGAQKDALARVTISEQITKDLSITYSQDLASDRQQIILIEYFVSRNTSVVASRDETGALGLDVRFRSRFK